jgi:site-specific recombinase XerD
MEVLHSNPLSPSRATCAFKSRPLALSDPDITRLHQAIMSRPFPEDAGAAQIVMVHRDQAIALVLISTGITLEETCLLDTRDFQKAAGHHCIIARRYNRAIPLESETVKVITRWLTLRHLVYHGEEFRPLFITRKHERITSVTVRNVLERLKVDSGVTFNSFELRHTFIRRMVQQGYSLNEISAMLGRPSHGVIQMYADEMCVPNRSVAPI